MVHQQRIPQGSHKRNYIRPLLQGQAEIPGTERQQDVGRVYDASQSQTTSSNQLSSNIQSPGGQRPPLQKQSCQTETDDHRRTHHQGIIISHQKRLLSQINQHQGPNRTNNHGLIHNNSPQEQQRSNQHHKWQRHQCHVTKCLPNKLTSSTTSLSTISTSTHGDPTYLSGVSRPTGPLRSPCPGGMLISPHVRFCCIQLT